MAWLKTKKKLNNLKIATVFDLDFLNKLLFVKIEEKMQLQIKSYNIPRLI